jgi:hypothetical protein
MQCRSIWTHAIASRRQAVAWMRCSASLQDMKETGVVKALLVKSKKNLKHHNPPGPASPLESHENDWNLLHQPQDRSYFPGASIRFLKDVFFASCNLER